MSQRVAQAEKILGHHFSHFDMVQAALTHPSAAEHKPISASYERLEFLGDSILGAIVAQDMFERFPQMDEGELTRLKISLVSGAMLSQVGEDLGLQHLIYLGDSERGTGARGMHSALENVYEALVGALYLDGGWPAAERFVRKTLGPHITPQLALKPISPKSRLQEVFQQELHINPTYKLVSEEGPAHDPTFVCVVSVQGARLGKGSGSSKKAAETSAAEAALTYLDEVGTTDLMALLERVCAQGVHPADR